MKNKKIIAFALAVGLIVSCFGGIGISYAQGGGEEVCNDTISKLPATEHIDVEIDSKSQQEIPVNEILINQDEQIIYDSADSKSDPNADDKFNLGQCEIEELTRKGYSVEELFKIDDVANELSIEPIEIVKKMENTGKSLEEVRDDILNVCNSKKYNNLKKMYHEEYVALVDRNMEDKDILLLLTYIDLRKVELTESLIQEYEEKGTEIFNTACAEISKK